MTSLWTPANWRCLLRVRSGAALWLSQWRRLDREAAEPNPNHSKALALGWASRSRPAEFEVQLGKA